MRGHERMFDDQEHDQDRGTKKRALLSLHASRSTFPNETLNIKHERRAGRAGSICTPIACILRTSSNNHRIYIYIYIYIREAGGFHP
jgi:hypothetical protein